MTHEEINRHKKEVINYILSGQDEYLTNLNGRIPQDINIFHEKNDVDNFTKKYFKVAGFSVKNADALNDCKKFIDNEYREIKMFDIFINLEAIQEYCQSVKEKYSIDFELNDAVRSIITHELMHSISVGFEGMKDEAHTDYLAKRIFQALYPDKNYFTSYDYPQTDEYKSEMSKITDNSIKEYLGTNSLKEEGRI